MNQINAITITHVLLLRIGCLFNGNTTAAKILFSAITSRVKLETASDMVSAKYQNLHVIYLITPSIGHTPPSGKRVLFLL